MNSHQSKMSKEENKEPQLSNKFKIAVDYLQSLPKDGSYQSPPQEKLEFYALFKQATEGRCVTKKPSRLNMVSKAKWSSWNNLGNMSKDEAMRKYISKILELSSKIPGKQSEKLRKELENTSKM